MFKKILAVNICLLVLSGCVYDDELMPEITHDYSISETIQPKPATPAKTRFDSFGSIPRWWLPPASTERNWTAIVIHHSGTRNGNAAIFDKWHREGNHWEGVGYDFVIGNGTNSGNGEVEVTYRWNRQVTGAHCGGTANNWANKEAIGICLVGNFNQTSPSPQQIQSLVKLIRFLQNRYNIPKNRIYGHNTTPGASITDCPGKNFPMDWVKSMADF